MPSVAGTPDAQTQYLFDEIRRLHSVIDARNQQQPPPAPQFVAQPQPQVPQTPAGWYGNPPRYWNGVAWQDPVPAPAAAPAAEPVAPVAQPTPIESAKMAMNTVLELDALNKKIKEQISDPHPVIEDVPEEPPKPEAAPFPMQAHDFGAFRMAAVSEDGGPPKLVEGMMPFAMLNADKIAAGAKSLLGEIGAFMDTRINQGTKVNDQQAVARRRAVEDAERLAAAQKQIAEANEQSARAEALKAQALQMQRQLEAKPAPPLAPAPAQVRAEPVTVHVEPPMPPPEPPKPGNGNGNGISDEKVRDEVARFVEEFPIDEPEPATEEPKAPVLSEN